MTCPSANELSGGYLHHLLVAAVLAQLESTAGLRQFHIMQGLAAFIAINEPVTESQERVGAVNNEVYVTYPDSSDRRTQYPGDTQAALAPLLAHRYRPG